jgi:prepilin-type N-terminal cleavage/methylation domain-containing protein/prepilin-type processing-associated H-X9-DG protein
MFNLSSEIFRRLKKTRSGFTLTELLVVIATIALLISILTPVLGKAKVIARRTACRSQLRGVGMAIRMYVDDNDQTMPVAAQLPSEEPNLPCITDVLLPYLKNKKAMCCPGDRLQEYFEKEGSSYEYPHFVRGRKVDDTFMGEKWGEANTPVLFDYGPFHNRKGRRGAINFLFGDGHVGDLLETNI